MDDAVTFHSRDQAFRRHERSFRRIVIQLGELERRDPGFARSRKAAVRLLHRAEESGRLARRLAELTGHKDDFQLWEESVAGKHGDIWNDFQSEIKGMKSEEIRQDVISIVRAIEMSAAREDQDLLVTIHKILKSLKGLNWPRKSKTLISATLMPSSL